MQALKKMTNKILWNPFIHGMNIRGKLNYF